MTKDNFDFYSPFNLKAYNLDIALQYQLKLLESLDPFTRKHSENVANLVCRICKYMHFNTKYSKTPGKGWLKRSKNGWGREGRKEGERNKEKNEEKKHRKEDLSSTNKVNNMKNWHLTTPDLNCKSLPVSWLLF